MVCTKNINILLNDKVFEHLRLYDGVPSVTSILKILEDSPAFAEFRQHDPVAFEEMLKRKGALGTRLHEIIEKSYIKGTFCHCPTVHGKAWLKFYTEKGSKRKPVALEQFVGDDKVAGRFDAVMDIDQAVTLVDWKTCGQRIYPELIDKYKLQTSKYMHLYNTTHDVQITQIKIVMFSDKGWYKVIDVETPDVYNAVYDEIIEQFYEMYNQYLELNANLGNSQSNSSPIVEQPMSDQTAQ